MEKKKIEHILFYSIFKFVFNITRFSNISSANLLVFGELFIVAYENNRSTGADDGRGVLKHKKVSLMDGYLVF